MQTVAPCTGWWTQYVTWLRAPVTVLVLLSSVLRLAGQELVAGGVRAERAALQRAWTTAPSWPTLDGAIAAVQRTYDDTNAAWALAEQSLTHALFGWVNSTALAAHDVLHGALDLATGTVDDMLGHTPLHDPVAQFVQCVLGGKVQSADTALQWVQTHATVQLPRLPPPPQLAGFEPNAHAVLAGMIDQWDATTKAPLVSARWLALSTLLGVPSTLLVVAILTA